jgi:hypothetical protein
MSVLYMIDRPAAQQRDGGWLHGRMQTKESARAGASEGHAYLLCASEPAGTAVLCCTYVDN